MPFWLRTQVGPRNHVLNGRPHIPNERGNLGEEAPIVKCMGCLSRVSCDKTAEPIEMVFLALSRVEPRNHVLHGVQISLWKGTILREACSDMPDDTLT